MSRGQFQSRNQSGKRPFAKQKGKGTHDNVVIIDDESSLPTSKGSGTSRPDKRHPSRRLTIIIDDDDDDAPRNSDNCGDIDSDATSSKKYKDVIEDPYDDECQMFVCERKQTFKLHKCTKSYPRKGPSKNRFGLFLESECSTSESDGSDCEVMDGSSGNIREQWEKASSRKQKLKGVQNFPFDVDDQASASGSNIDPRNSSHGNVSKDFGTSNSSSGQNTKQGIMDEHSLEDEIDLHGADSDGQLSDTAVTNQTVEANKKKEDLSGCEATVDEIMDEHSLKFEIKNPIGDSNVQLSDTSVPNQNVDANSTKQDDLSGCAATADGIVDERSLNSGINRSVADSDSQLSNTAVVNQTVDAVDKGTACSGVGEKLVPGELSLSNPQIQDETYAMSLISDGQNGDGMVEFQNNLIAEREKLKETTAYRLAEQEEWASRQRELQIQAEEAQRLRKRKKAEIVRLLDMERRQKQRVEEIRETQKKGEETINMKEQLRVEIRKELDKLEVRFRDMASLLRTLGIHVEGGLYPTSHEVNAAYKQALLKFHPDRASRWDIRRQVEAEETFKLITRLKDQLYPANLTVRF